MFRFAAFAAIVCLCSVMFAQEPRLGNEIGQYDDGRAPIVDRPLIAERFDEHPTPPPPLETIEAQRDEGLRAGAKRFDVIVDRQILEYKLGRITIEGSPKFVDIMLMRFDNKSITFAEVVETKQKGVYVFTGAPGKYSIRIVAFDETKGFTHETRETEIVASIGGDGGDDGGSGGSGEPPVEPPTVDPNEPPLVDNGIDPPGVPEGVYGFGTLSYSEAMKLPNPSAVASKVAANFAWAATAPGDITVIMQQLADRNAPIYTPEWQPFRVAWKAHADRLVLHGILPQTIEDYRVAWKETANGLSVVAKRKAAR